MLTNEEKLEKVARELCLAAGKSPDEMVRLGEPLSFAAGDCMIVKPLFLPAWKTYSREARRLAMSDAEHAEHGAANDQSEGARKRRPAFRDRRSATRRIRIKLYRRLRRMRFGSRLRGLWRSIEAAALARNANVGRYPS